MRKNLSLLLVLLTFNSFSQTWQLLIPASAYDGTKLNLSSTAYDRINNKIYSVLINQNAQMVYSFDLNNDVVDIIPTTNNPAEIRNFTFDVNNQRIIGARSGRDALFSVSTSGGGWTSFGQGNFDSENYGGWYFFDQNTDAVKFFGGYGLYQVKNWVWSNDGSTWINEVGNNSNCDNTTPPKRQGPYPALGAPNSSDVYFFSGYGSCDGSQMASSCALGSPWATDVGVWCWLRDLWKYNYQSSTFTQLLPPNHPSITSEGMLVYNHVGNTFYIVGGFIPPAIADPNFYSNANYQVSVLRYRVGIDNGFVPYTVFGTPPPTLTCNQMGSHLTYYDAINNRIIWIRKDGVYAIELSSADLDEKHHISLTLFPNPTNKKLQISGISDWNEVESVEIINIYGQTIRTIKKPISAEVDCYGISSGTFFLKLSTTSGLSIQQFVIE
jgi:hypothetical protein